MATKHELIAAIGDAMRAYQRAHDVIDELATERAGVNRTDGRCLDILQENGPLTAGTLAKLTGLTTGAITSAVDRMEHVGLAQRVRDEHDRRKVLVELTPAAHAICEAVYQPLAAKAFATLERYTAAELEVILDFVRRTLQLAEDHADYVRRLIAQAEAMSSRS